MFWIFLERGSHLLLIGGGTCARNVVVQRGQLPLFRGDLRFEISFNIMVLLLLLYYSRA